MVEQSFWSSMKLKWISFGTKDMLNTSAGLLINDSISRFGHRVFIIRNFLKLYSTTQIFTTHAHPPIFYKRASANPISMNIFKD